MSDGTTEPSRRSGSSEGQEATPPSGRELPGLRGGGDERPHEVHPMRPEERTFVVGQRVELHGEIILVSADGTREPWLSVRLDGERKHIVFVHQSDTQHKGDTRP